jgi:hypothetical protein
MFIISRMCSERLSCLDIDNELELGRLLRWQIAGVLAIQNSSDIIARLTSSVSEAGAVTHYAAKQGTVYGLLAIWKGSGIRRARCKFRDPVAMVVEESVSIN